MGSEGLDELEKASGMDGRRRGFWTSVSPAVKWGKRGKKGKIGERGDLNDP